MVVKLIKSVIQFLSFSAVFYVLLLIVWSHLLPFDFLKKNAPYPIGAKGFTYTRMNEADTTKDIDILFLGSSHAYRGFDTRIYRDKNIKSFNLGSPSQSPIQTKLLVERYIKQLNPKLVIYEVYPATFQNDGVESALDIIANSNRISSTFNMVKDVNHIKVYNAYIYDTFREAFGLNEGFTELTKKKNDAYVKNGFVETNLKYNVSPITAKTKKLWSGRAWEIKDYQWKAFNETLKVIEKKSIKVWLIQTPVTSDAYALYANNDYIDSLFTMKGYYHNFNNSLTLDDSLDFADYHHLNQSGVNKTNTALLNLIIKNDDYFKKIANSNE